jgi:hypothetical protein
MREEIEMTDKTDAEFEAWWQQQPHREQFEDVKGQMRNVWVASRQEAVIVLPEASKAADFMFATKVINAGYAIAAIEAAGAKWRE